MNEQFEDRCGAFLVSLEVAQLEHDSSSALSSGPRWDFRMALGVHSRGTRARLADRIVWRPL